MAGARQAVPCGIQLAWARHRALLPRRVSLPTKARCGSGLILCQWPTHDRGVAAAARRGPARPQPRSDARGGALALAARGRHLSSLPRHRRGPDPTRRRVPSVRPCQSPCRRRSTLGQGPPDPNEEKPRFPNQTRFEHCKRDRRAATASRCRSMPMIRRGGLRPPARLANTPVSVGPPAAKSCALPHRGDFGCVRAARREKSLTPALNERNDQPLVSFRP